MNIQKKIRLLELVRGRGRREREGGREGRREREGEGEGGREGGRERGREREREGGEGEGEGGREEGRGRGRGRGRERGRGRGRRREKEGVIFLLIFHQLHHLYIISAVQNREDQLRKNKMIGRVKTTRPSAHPVRLHTLAQTHFKWQRGRKLG